MNVVPKWTVLTAKNPAPSSTCLCKIANVSVGTIILLQQTIDSKDSSEKKDTQMSSNKYFLLTWVFFAGETLHLWFIVARPKRHGAMKTMATLASTLY